MRFRSLVAARAKGVDSRIVGGVEAEPHSLPWQIAMLNTLGSQMCGGSIVGDLHSPMSNKAISMNYICWPEVSEHNVVLIVDA